MPAGACLPIIVKSILVVNLRQPGGAWMNQSSANKSGNKWLKLVSSIAWSNLRKLHNLLCSSHTQSAISGIKPSRHATDCVCSSNHQIDLYTSLYAPSPLLHVEHCRFNERGMDSSHNMFVVRWPNSFKYIPSHRDHPLCVRGLYCTNSRFYVKKAMLCGPVQ